jgi:hypothetical protein
VVGPWLVNTGSDVGPPPTPDDGLSSAAASSDLRRPAVGDVGAEPAPDRLPTPPTDTAPVTGGTMQERRFRGVCAPPPRENRRPDSAMSLLLHSPVVGVASGLVEAGERAYTGTAEKCSSGMRIRPEHLAHTWRQQRAHRTPQLNRVKRVRMHRKHTCKHKHRKL